MEAIEKQVSPIELSFKMDFRSMDDILDFLEIKFTELGDLIDCNVKHRFSKGLYTREAHAPAGSLIISKTHLTDHQFIISKGSCAVFVEGEGWLMMEAPFHGLTKMGTRRLLYVFEDLIWTSMHPSNKTTVKEVEMEIIDQRKNGFLKGGKS